MTSVRDYLAQPSLCHEPRPSRTPAATLVDGDEFDRLALTFAVVEDAHGIPWVRCENAEREPHWYARNKQRQYAQINVVCVLSKGVQ